MSCGSGLATPQLTRVWVRVSALVLLLLLIPQLFYAGHWSMTGHMPETAGGREEHKQHCHTDIATCSQLPLPSGPGQFLINQELLPEPDLYATVTLHLEHEAPHGLSVRPLSPPPRSPFTAPTAAHG